MRAGKQQSRAFQPDCSLWGFHYCSVRAFVFSRGTPASSHSQRTRTSAQMAIQKSSTRCKWINQVERQWLPASVWLCSKLQINWLTCSAWYPPSPRDSWERLQPPSHRLFKEVSFTLELPGCWWERHWGFASAVSWGQLPSEVAWGLVHRQIGTSV